MSRDWYNRIAKERGGYLKTLTSELEGISGEDVFTQRLFDRLDSAMHVLDAGCGSGGFTLSVAPFVNYVVGFDFAEEMVNVAKKKRSEVRLENITFTCARTRKLPFEEASFDLIYSRRGPTSILLSPELLKPGGVMMGVHSGGLEKIREGLEGSGLTDIRVEVFAATEHFSHPGRLGRVLVQDAWASRLINGSPHRRAECLSRST